MLASGGVGSLSGELHAGFYGDKNVRGIKLSFIPSFSWQNGKQLIDTSTNSFSFGGLKGSVSMWTGPILLTFQGAYYSVLSNSDEPIAKYIDKNFVWTVMAAVRIGEQSFLQVKSLVPEKKLTREMLEISFVRTLNI
jgi:hypothetical protein